MQTDPRDVDALVEDAAMLMGLSVMATRLERDGFVNAAHYMRTGANRIISHATTITALQAEVASLKGQIATIQRAAKTIMIHEADELVRLRKQKQEWHLAIQTLESERAANAILTEQVERLEARAALGQQP